MTRLALRISAGTLTAMVVSFSVAHAIHTRSIRSRLRAGLPMAVSGGLELARQRLARATDPEATARELDALRRAYSVPGRVVKIEELSTGQASLPAQLWAGRVAWSVDDQELEVTVYLPMGDGVGALELGPFSGLEKPGVVPFALGLTFILGVVGLTGFALSAGIVRRTRSLQRAADAISEGDLGSRVEVRVGDAIASLAGAFNRMADKNQALLEGHRQLLQAVSHELRTPTARIRFGFEMYAAAEDDSDRERHLAGIEADLTELDDLVSELLIYNRAVGEPAPLERRLFPVGPLVEDVVEGQRHISEGVPVELIAPETEVELSADPRGFRRVLQNLLANALRHTCGGVTIRWIQTADEVRLEVIDDGPGVPANCQDSIFHPFGRADASRCRHSGGVGLGLAIVRRIVEAHGGQVTVHDALGRGARFVTTWPLSPSGSGVPGAG